MNFVRVITYAAFFMLLSSCSKYEDGPMLSWKSKTQRLAGVWTVTSVAGQPTAKGQEITLVFEKGGDFIYYDTQNVNGWIENGLWEWIKQKKNLEIHSNGSHREWHITQLSNYELGFTDENNIEYRCVKK